MIKSHTQGDLQLFTCTTSDEYQDLAKNNQVVYSLEECEMSEHFDTEFREALLRMKIGVPFVRVLTVEATE